jgi:hypothetical protein
MSRLVRSSPIQHQPATANYVFSSMRLLIDFNRDIVLLQRLKFASDNRLVEPQPVETRANTKTVFHLFPRLLSRLPESILLYLSDKAKSREREPSGSNKCEMVSGR